MQFGIHFQQFTDPTLVRLQLNIILNWDGLNCMWFTLTTAMWIGRERERETALAEDEKQDSRITNV